MASLLDARQAAHARGRSAVEGERERRPEQGLGVPIRRVQGAPNEGIPQGNRRAVSRVGK